MTIKSNSSSNINNNNIMKCIFNNSISQFNINRNFHSSNNVKGFEEFYDQKKPNEIVIRYSIILLFYYYKLLFIIILILVVEHGQQLILEEKDLMIYINYGTFFIRNVILYYLNVRKSESNNVLQQVQKSIVILKLRNQWQQLNLY